jgi:hypothetical protein
MPASAGTGQEGADLAVLDPAGGAEVLPLHPRRHPAFLQEPGVVHDQHPARLTVADLLAQADTHTHRANSAEQADHTDLTDPADSAGQADQTEHADSAGRDDQADSAGRDDWADQTDRTDQARTRQRSGPDTAPSTDPPSQPITGDPEPHPHPRPGRGAPAEPSSTRAGVEIRVGLGTLLGLDDHPAEIPTLGPVLAPIARNLVAAQARGAQWRFAITDPDGYLLLAGTIRQRPTGTHHDRCTGGIVEIQLPAELPDQLTTHPASNGPWARVINEIAARYRDRDHLLAALDHNPSGRFPHAALARHIEVRDRTCTFMHCRCPAHNSDLDHTVDHAQGGPATSTNLGRGCGRHHPYKHKLGWRLEQPRPGHFTWTSPLGRTYHTRGQPITPPLPPPSHPTRPTNSDHDPRPPPPDNTHDEESPPF